MNQASKKKRSLDSNPNCTDQSFKSAKVTNKDDKGLKGTYVWGLFCNRIV